MSSPPPSPSFLFRARCRPMPCMLPLCTSCRHPCTKNDRKGPLYSFTRLLSAASLWGIGGRKKSDCATAAAGGGGAQQDRQLFFASLAFRYGRTSVDGGRISTEHKMFKPAAAWRPERSCRRPNLLSGGEGGGLSCRRYRPLIVNSKKNIECGFPFLLPRLQRSRGIWEKPPSTSDVTLNGFAFL